jgi:hypothetical protein
MWKKKTRKWKREEKRARYIVACAEYFPVCLRKQNTARMCMCVHVCVRECMCICVCVMYKVFLRRHTDTGEWC